MKGAVVLLVLARGVAADEAPPATAIAAPARGHGFVGSVGLGVGYRELYAPGFASAVLDLRLGVAWRYVEVLLTVVGEAGGPNVRLPVWAFRAGPLVRAVIGGVRIGFGWRLGGYLLQRVTDGELLEGVTFAFFFSGSVDLVRRGRNALFLDAELGLTEGPSLAFAGTAMLGARF